MLTYNNTYYKPMQKLIICILASGLITTAACKKNSGAGTGNTSDVNVYVLGTVGDTLTYWKNGAPHHLYSQSRMIYNLGSPSIFASGSDVYVAGFKLNNNTNSTIPVYWKNDATIILPDSTGYATANSIFISNNDVYVSGTSWYRGDTSHVPYTTPTAIYPKSGNVATLWKNGVPSILPGYHSVGLVGNRELYAVNTYADYVSSLFISGNDVYAAGGSRYYGYNAYYWKNGVQVDLTKGLIYSGLNGNLCYPNTTSIFVSNNDVYVAGFQMTASNIYRSRALFWKNGIPVYLTKDSTSGSEARSIFVTGNDVHIAGYQNINNTSRAMYWKNGVPTTLSIGGISSIASSIFVAGDDVYIAGYEWTAPNGKYIATYWKNGEQVKLTNGTTNAIASSIFVQ
jgi:hypothetical protein